LKLKKESLAERFCAKFFERLIMSRLGKLPVEITSGVTVEINGSTVTVKGPKGALSMPIRPEIEVKIEGNNVVTSLKVNSKKAPAFWGMTRAQIANMVEGVTKGYEKKLEMVGVGYRAKQNGSNISISAGYSHPIEVAAPEGIQLEVVDNQNIFIRGINKQLVGLIAANIRKIRKPEPYKGKGIKYSGEVIRRKVGKAGKTGAAK
jgi:large subunit ribosomal protein L6